MASLSSTWTYQCGGRVRGTGSRSRLCTTYPLWMLPLGLLVHTPHRLSGLRLVLPSKGHCLRVRRPATSTQPCRVHPAVPARGPRSHPEDWEPASAHAVSPPASSLHLVVAGAQSCTRPREGAGPLGHTAGFPAQRGLGGVQWGLGPRECAGVHRGYGVPRAWVTGCSQP